MPPPNLPRRAVLATAAASLAVPSLARAQRGEAVLRVVAPWEYTSNEPSDVGFILARMQVAEGLIGVEPDGRLVGLVAERWSVDEDHLTWRFVIRPGLRFHDDTPVTPAAVAASLSRALVGESLANVAVTRIAAEGDAVVIRTQAPFAPLPAFLVDYAAIILAPAAYGPDGKVLRVLGTGPYRLARIEGRTELELERFERYWGTPAPIARARYSAVANGETRANIAIAGDADLVFTLAPASVPRVNAARQMRVESLTIPRVRMITMNLGLPQFSDVRVRRALSMAIDRGGIAGAVLRHPGSAATQLLPPLLADWHDASLPPLANDQAAARALLDQAGWVPGADGVRVKDGARLEARLLTIANRPELPVMATAIQAQLRAVGMAISIDAGQSASIPAAVRDGSMQMTMFARTYVNVPDPIGTIIPDYGRPTSPWGSMHWPGHTQVRAMVEEYVASFDAARRAALRQGITRLIHEDMPVIPVSWFEHTVAISTRVAGAAVDPFEMRYLLDRVRWA